MDKTKVIYISGDKGVGKDTLADILSYELNKLGYTTGLIALAKPLKSLACSAFSISIDEVDEHKNDIRPITVLKRKLLLTLSKVLNIPISVLDREYLLRTGKAIRCIDEHLITNRVKKFIEGCSHDIVIVTDFRLLEEYVVKGYTIHIARGTGKPLVDNDIDGKLKDFKFDTYIDNNSDKETLYNNALELVRNIVSSFLILPVVKKNTNVIIDLEELSKNYIYLEDSLNNVKRLYGNDVKVTLVYSNEVADKYSNILKALYTEIKFNRSTYINPLKLKAIGDIDNVILVSNEHIHGYTNVNIHKFVHIGDIEVIRELVNINRKKYKGENVEEDMY